MQVARPILCGGLMSAAHDRGPQFSIAFEMPEPHSKAVAQCKENPGDPLATWRCREFFAITLDDSRLKAILKTLLEYICVRVELE